MQPESSGPFEIHIRGLARDQVTKLEARAIRLRIAEWFRDDLRLIYARLSSIPLVWGEPKYLLRKIDMIWCVGFQNRLAVWYAVHEGRRAVYFQNLFPLKGNPLFTSENG